MYGEYYLYIIVGGQPSERVRYRYFTPEYVIPAAAPIQILAWVLSTASRSMRPWSCSVESPTRRRWQPLTPGALPYLVVACACRAHICGIEYSPVRAVLVCGFSLLS